MTATDTEPGPRRGVYAISVAAELVGIGSQTLRLYERRGLLERVRSVGGTRRYSSEDLERLRRIARLVSDGVNLAGVAMVLDLQDANYQLRADLDNRVTKDYYAASGTSPGDAVDAVDAMP